MIELYGHPFSSYTWKALIALYETGTAFEFRTIAGSDHPENEAAFLGYWPVGKFPLLLDEGVAIPEASIIVEHVAPTLIPAERTAAREARLLDRIFDHHVMANVQAIIVEHLPHMTAQPDPARIDRAQTALGTLYPWLDARLAGRTWGAGDGFTLADCAAGPALFYADWVRPIGDKHTALTAYRRRLLARPSIARAVEEARPYRPLFPLGAPDRD